MKKIFTSHSFRQLLLLAVMALSVSSCKKYLDEPTQKNQVIPSNLADLQALLDNQSINHASPSLLEALGDNYTVLPAAYQQALTNSVTINNALNYVWDKNAYDLNSWYAPYQLPVFYANNALDIMKDIPLTEGNKAAWNNVAGSSYFYRAWGLFSVAQLYCKVYNSATASTDVGVPLKTNAIITEVSTRATVQQTYDQIISDYQKAIDLLPVTPVSPSRPGKLAAYGALARVYLFMRDYTNAGKYADLYMASKDALLDYNSLIPLKNPPVPTFNTEVTFYFSNASSALLGTSSALIDDPLYQSFNANDLRKTVFFAATAGGYFWQGNYGSNLNTSNLFNGVATDEVYLISAEVNARANNTAKAMDLLNKLLVKRWKTGTYTNLTATDGADALDKILVERRKELIYRGLRWPDIRRLNAEGANITLTRNINGTIYTLPPNDLRSIALIPPDVINLSGMQQNPR